MSPLPSAPERGSNELKIRCPVGIVAEENTTVSVFYTPAGEPACAGTGMSVTAFANNTYQSVQFSSCEPESGRHTFTVKTTVSGTYQVRAQYAELQAQCAFDVVGRAPTPTPELSGWLVLAAALAAFGLTRKGRD